MTGHRNANVPYDTFKEKTQVCLFHLNKIILNDPEYSCYVLLSFPDHMFRFR